MLSLKARAGDKFFVYVPAGGMSPASTYIVLVRRIFSAGVAPRLPVMRSVGQADFVSVEVGRFEGFIDADPGQPWAVSQRYSLTRDSVSTCGGAVAMTGSQVTPSKCHLNFGAAKEVHIERDGIVKGRFRA